MKTFCLLFALMVASSAAFAPNLFGVHTQASSALFAKHVQLKATKWAASKRPKKSRPSDKNRAPINYELHSMTKPSEYTVADAPAVLMAKPAAVVPAKEE